MLRHASELHASFLCKDCQYCTELMLSLLIDPHLLRIPEYAVHTQAGMHCMLTCICNCRDQSGPVIAFAITAGLTAGSLLALLLVAALQTRL